MSQAPPTSRLNRLKRQQWLLGIACTLVVIAAWGTGIFRRFELPTIDWRTRWFNRWAPGPSPDVVIMGIGDAATDPETGVGRWPWSREVLAEAVGELQLAGAKTIALDVLLESPQPEEGADEALAAAIEAHGGVILPFRSRADAPREAVTALIVASNAEFRGILEQHFDEVASQLIAERLAAEGGDGAGVTPARVGPAGVGRVLPAARALIGAEDRSTAGVGKSAGVLPAPALQAEIPIPMLVAAAAGIGDVSINSSFDDDGVLRRLPLWTRMRDERLWPAFSLAAVADFLDTPIAKIHPGPGSVIEVESLPPRRIRVTASGSHPYVLPITWPRGGNSWSGQFSSGGGNGTDAPREVSILAAMEPFLIRRAATENLRTLENLLVLAGGLNLGEYGQAAELVRVLRETAFDAPGWWGALDEVAAAVTPASVEAADFLDFAGEVDLAELSAEDARTYLNHRRVAEGIPAILAECRGAPGRIEEARRRLKKIAGGRLVFVGWVASGALADTVNTSLVKLTPGVYIHGAAASSFLNGFIRLPVAPGVDALFIALLGVCGILAARRVSVWLAPVFILVVLGVWFLVAGVVLWDVSWRVASVAAPSVAAVASWLAVLLHRLLVEQRLRRRTEERFRAYVSPAVVDELVNNPELDSMTPRRRELAIMFCDVTGFTAIAERLGAEGTARFLTGYLGKMTETLLRHNATIDKYLGDGIMAFWGAPLSDPRHARHACRAAIALVRAVADLSPPDPRPGDPSHITIRIGLAAGDVMVGDFGNPPVRSSYTVLGDACNIAARLERASKLLGTTILASATIRAQAGDGFIWRRLGVFILHGRLGPEPIFELLGMTIPGSKAASDETLAIGSARQGTGGTDGAGGSGGRRVDGETLGAWIAATEEAVGAFAAGRYEEARGRFMELAREYGDDGLARVYLPAIERRISGEALDEPVDAVRLSVS